jgi:hypothetical protein
MFSGGLCDILPSNSVLGRCSRLQLRIEESLCVTMVAWRVGELKPRQQRTKNLLTP